MPELSLHPLIQRDLRQVLDHYFVEGGEKLADKFFAEAEYMVEPFGMILSIFILSTIIIAELISRHSLIISYLRLSSLALV